MREATIKSFGSSPKELIQMKGSRFRGFKGSSDMFYAVKRRCSKAGLLLSAYRHQPPSNPRILDPWDPFCLTSTTPAMLHWHPMPGPGTRDDDAVNHHPESRVHDRYNLAPADGSHCSSMLWPFVVPRNQRLSPRPHRKMGRAMSRRFRCDRPAFWLCPRLLHTDLGMAGTDR